VESTIYGAANRFENYCFVDTHVETRPLSLLSDTVVMVLSSVDIIMVLMTCSPKFSPRKS